MAIYRTQILDVRVGVAGATVAYTAGVDGVAIFAAPNEYNAVWAGHGAAATPRIPGAGGVPDATLGTIYFTSTPTAAVAYLASTSGTYSADVMVGFNHSRIA